MNNLYNKIYEAVDKGIQKALIIKDDQSQDTSVNWHNKQTSAEFEPYKQNIKNILNIEYYDHWNKAYDNAEIIQTNWKEIAELHINSGYEYQLESWEQLTELINRIYWAKSHHNKFDIKGYIIDYFNFDKLLEDKNNLVEKYIKIILNIKFNPEYFKNDLNIKDIIQPAFDKLNKQQAGTYMLNSWKEFNYFLLMNFYCNEYGHKTPLNIEFLKFDNLINNGNDPGEKYINILLNTDIKASWKKVTSYFLKSVFEQFNNFCNDNNYAYKLESWKQFKKINNCIQEIKDNDDNEEIIEICYDNFNYDNLMTAMSLNGTEMSLCPSSNNMPFIKIKGINNIDIIIHKNMYIRKIKWANLDQIDNDNYVDNYENDHDTDGWNNTYNNDNIQNMPDYNYTFTNLPGVNIKYNDNNFENYPVFRYVSSLANQLNIYNYKAYVPAINELKAIFNKEYFEFITDILNYYLDDADISDKLKNKQFWTSTEDGPFDVFVTDNKFQEKTVNKNEINYILPFFKKITD